VNRVELRKQMACIHQKRVELLAEMAKGREQLVEIQQRTVSLQQQRAEEQRQLNVLVARQRQLKNDIATIKHIHVEHICSFFMLIISDLIRQII
jgi:hypothetical protein